VGYSFTTIFREAMSTYANERPLHRRIGARPPQSTSERAVWRHCEARSGSGPRPALFDGVFVSGLPLYVPDRKERTEPERDYIETMRRCDGVIVGRRYHGSYPDRSRHPGSARDTAGMNGLTRGACLRLRRDGLRWQAVARPWLHCA